VPYLEDEGWRVVQALVALLDQGSDTARHLHGEGLHVAPSLPLYTPEIWQRCRVMLHNGYILLTNFAHPLHTCKTADTEDQGCDTQCRHVTNMENVNII